MKHKPKRIIKVAAGTFSLIALVVIAISAIAATVLVPYVIESWGMWLGYHPVIEWWKGVLIFLAFAIFTRWGAAGTTFAAAAITVLFDLCGFTGI